MSGERGRFPHVYKHRLTGFYIVVKSIWKYFMFGLYIFLIKDNFAYRSKPMYYFMQIFPELRKENEV